MVFETKKLNIETLSEYLQKVRGDFKLSLRQVSQKTGIPEKFLECLEQNKFSALPPDVYVLGFLKRLGQLYAVDSALLVEQYKKERAIAQQLAKTDSRQSAPAKRYLGRLVITPKMLALAVGAAFTILTVAYIIWQIFSINRTPSLAVYAPQDRQVVSGTSVSVAGKTDPGMSLSLNDQNIFVDSQGDFKTQISVEEGPKELVFIAKNKFGKTVTKTVTVVGQSSPNPQQPSRVVLELTFSDTVTITAAMDDAASQDIVFHAGDKKTFVANEKIVIATSNAGATAVLFNGQNLGPMGRSGERLKGVLFTPRDKQ